MSLILFLPVTQAIAGSFECVPEHSPDGADDLEVTSPYSPADFNLPDNIGDVRRELSPEVFSPPQNLGHTPEHSDIPTWLERVRANNI